MLLEKNEKWYTKMLLEKMIKIIKKWYTKMLLEKMIKMIKNMMHKNAAGKNDKTWYTKMLLENNDKKMLKIDTQKCCWKKMITRMMHKNAAGKKMINKW